MRFAQFQSNNPVDHVSRVLGQLERMGFALRSMAVERDNSNLSKVKIVFEPAGPLPVEVFADRITKLRGVSAFDHGQVG